MNVQRKMYDTDQFYKDLWSVMVRDCRSAFSDPSLFVEEELQLRNSIKDFRFESFKGSYFLSPYYYFKWRYQMESLLKRYRFDNDAYTDSELELESSKKFVATQVRLAELWKGNIPYRSLLVIKKARSIVKAILGRYDSAEHLLHCQFGKRASVGVPYSKSYLDLKCGSPLTGSSEHITWFEQTALKNDRLLEGALSSCTPMAYPRYKLCSNLTLSLVPKSWKAMRSIMPNTIIGGYYTAGLGKLLELKLRSAGLDIRRLQDKHRDLVLRYSKTRSHVTADLSSASDSFTSQLVNMLVPREWYRALNLGRIKEITLPSNKTVTSVTFCTMGIGFTFPLQTLLFYSLLKSIQGLLSKAGKVSVFGDDLIYPRDMHTYVLQCFTDLGFILNEDKTFVYQSFRESCGEDAYCGFSVRPFSPKGKREALKRSEYHMLLYKTINGLQRRWDESELPITMRWLYSEVLRVSDSIFQVPTTYPDYSGVKVDGPRRDFLLPWSKPRSNGNGVFTFPFLSFSRPKRPITWQFPFYWDCLRKTVSSVESEPELLPGFMPLSDRVDRLCRIDRPKVHHLDFWKRYPELDSDTPHLCWVKVTTKSWRSSCTGARFNYKLRPMVTVKGALSSVRTEIGTAISWTEAS